MGILNTNIDRIDSDVAQTIFKTSESMVRRCIEEPRTYQGDVEVFYRANIGKYLYGADLWATGSNFEKIYGEDRITLRRMDWGGPGKVTQHALLVLISLKDMLKDGVLEWARKVYVEGYDYILFGATSLFITEAKRPMNLFEAYRKSQFMNFNGTNQNVMAMYVNACMTKIEC